MAFQGLPALMRQIERQYQSPAQQQWRQLQQQWPAIVGDRLAAQTRLVNLQQQVLQVAVANPMWVQTLMFERPKLLKKLNAGPSNSASNSASNSPNHPPANPMSGVDMPGVDMPGASMPGAIEKILDIRFSTAGWYKSPPSGTPYEANGGLHQHPCQLIGTNTGTSTGRQPEKSPPPEPPKLSTSPTPPSPLPPTDPLTAFATWATRIHDRDQSLPSCPACGVAAPPGELDRWGSCAICFAQSAFRPNSVDRGSATA